MLRRFNIILLLTGFAALLMLQWSSSAHSDEPTDLQDAHDCVYCLYSANDDDIDDPIAKTIESITVVDDYERVKPTQNRSWRVGHYMNGFSSRAPPA